MGYSYTNTFVYLYYENQSKIALLFSTTICSLLYLFFIVECRTEERNGGKTKNKGKFFLK